MSFQPVVAALMALASKSLLVSDYHAHVQKVVDTRPDETDKIYDISHLNVDYVIHYEQAILLGTTAEYEEHSKIYHFDKMLEAVDKNCNEIELATCVREMVCKKTFAHNFNLRLMNCNL
jgi:hypothetical protein